MTTTPKGRGERRTVERNRSFDSWRRSGGRLSHYVTVHGEGAKGFSLAPDLLSEMGRLGVEFGVEALTARQRS